MTRRDLELLDKQLRGLNPPRKDGILGLAVVAVFFIGIAIGGILFANEDAAGGSGAGPQALHSLLARHPSLRQ
jgi:hypothetical protein